MNASCDTFLDPVPPWRSRFPRLAALGLSDADVSSLAQQGFVSGGRLPSGRIAFKLRFRQGGTRQRVKYLGVDKERADAVAEELRRLQAGRRRERQLKRLCGEASALMKDVKERLAPLFAEVGIVFRGHEPRRKRRGRAKSIVCDKQAPAGGGESRFH